MAPKAALRDRRPLPFHLLLLLLLPLPGPARGNEGGAAGSCRCRRVASRPRFLDRLESCDTCQGFVRFIFPKRRECGLKEAEWVRQLQESHCGKATGPSPASAGVSRDKTQELRWTAESPTEAAWVPAMLSSRPEPRAEAAAVDANQALLEEEKAGGPVAPAAKAPFSIPALGLALVAAAAAAAVLVGCWRRQQGNRSQAG
ncbi:C-X-C motif chemokine 16 [Paroedura picta]|uniref:C-X-C motif chemokine 16 n=1 Tax=Paroedura picta TaxID=143630 RepID=UPI004055DC6A